jgi:hypothetical protein
MHDDALLLYFCKNDYTGLMHRISLEVESATLSTRQYWLRKLVKYMRKINGKLLSEYTKV